jgi:diguanylate cyclase (GGDEF)-like protein
MKANLKELERRIVQLEREAREKEETIARLLRNGQEREERYESLIDLNVDLMQRVEKHHLTGLYNKTAFETRVTDFITRMSRFAHKRKADVDGPPYGVFVLLDLNNFKFVNDVIGHTAGDEVLILIAQFLSYRFKHDPRDIVGHLGGDEFALLLNSIDMETAHTIIKRDVLSAVRNVKPSDVDLEQFKTRMNRDFIVDASYGIVAVNSPGLSYSSLMNLAENKMPKLANRRKVYGE